MRELVHEMHAKSHARTGGEGDLALADLATRQYGVVSRPQLIALGIGRGAISHRVKRGRLHPIHVGVYLLGHRQLSQRGRWLAAVLAHGAGAALSHGSAAALWGLARPSGPADVTSAHGRKGRSGIRLHRGEVHPGEARELDRIPVTTVARTLFDLAEAIDESRLERAWEEADRLNLLRLREVEEVCKRSHGRRALKPTRRLLAKASAPVTTRSPLEDRFAAFCRDHRLPPPATNAEILGYEVDALWLKERFVVELDGFAFHHHRAAFERDRARDAALQAAGYRTIRLTDRRLQREPNRVTAELRSLLGIRK